MEDLLEMIVTNGRYMFEEGHGVEYYYATRQNLDSQRGRANRLLVGFNFGFQGAGRRRRAASHSRFKACSCLAA